MPVVDHTLRDRPMMKKKSKTKATNKYPDSGSSGGSAHSRSARARLRQLEQQEAKARRARRLVIGAAIAVVVLAIAAGAVVIASLQGESDSPTAAAGAAAGRRDLPPWELPDNPSEAAKAAGLRIGPMEGTAAHFHSHLDITVNGQPIVVPANIGIDLNSGQMSELHTHDERGVLHVEAPTAGGRYTLGQVFTEWRVRLDASGVGGLNNTKTDSLRAYVDGKRFRGDPATIELSARRQISLIYGPRAAEDNPAASYDFEPGE